jgi:hypothetical protein
VEVKLHAFHNETVVGNEVGTSWTGRAFGHNVVLDMLNENHDILKRTLQK